MPSWAEATVRTLTRLHQPFGEVETLLRLMLHLPELGHTCLRPHQLAEVVQDLEEFGIVGWELERLEGELERALARPDLGAGFWVVKEGSLAWHRDHNRERELAEALWNLARSGNREGDLPEPEGPLEEEQRRAFVLLAQAPLALIAGGPGTGKSHVILSYLRSLDSEARERVWVAAPTGRAASRLKEGLGHLKEVTTVHRLLGLRPEYAARERYHPSRPLVGEQVILDEASMLDVDLLLALVKALGPGTRLALVGDDRQLPSIEGGAVFQDLVAAASVIPELEDGCLCRLTKNHRQQAQSATVRALASYLGKVRGYHGGPLPEPEGLDWRPKFHRDQVLDYAVELWRPKLDAAREGQPLEAWLKGEILLLPLRRGTWGVERFQEDLKLRLGKGRLAEGFPILVRRNQPHLGLANGDRGRLRQDRGRWVVDFPQPEGLARTVPLASLSEWEDGFALTVHKSQGSEFDHVVLVITPEASALMSQELYYTAITRARQKLTLFAAEADIQNCLRRPTRRMTLLGDLFVAHWKTPLTKG